MKKRILCFVLSVVLIFALLPVNATRVQAAAFDPSADCIAILKQLEGFCRYPYWDYGQYTVGYGTYCPPENYDRYCAEGISEEEAELLLRNFLTGMCGVLNNFINNNGLNLAQHQFDALLLFTYNCGSGWMNDPEGMFSGAVLQGKTGNDFIFPIVRWCVAGDSILEGLIRRRLSEANMYLNGQYATYPPENYCYVRYEGNGGNVSYRIQGYDSNTPANILSVATRSGYTFDGWYTARSGGTKVNILDASVRNRTLYAQWRDGSGNIVDSNTDPAVGAGTPINPVTVTVTGTEINLRQGPGTDYAIVGEANYGQQFTITATASGSGYTWGKFDGGWIALTFTNYDTVKNESNNSGSNTPENTPAQTVMGTITSDDGLRIRSGAGTDYSIVGFLNYNERVTILEQTTVGGTAWGRISSGWICMDYVRLDGQPETPAPEQPAPPAETTPPETTPPAPPAAEVKKGTVDADCLNIRSGPSTGYPVVGYLYDGDKVEITEQKTSGSMVWGKITQGWISMDYVDLDTAQDTGGSSTPSGGTVSGEVGKVVFTDSLRIRSGPSTDYDIVGYLSGGETVTVTQRTTVGGMEWGKIAQGWICLDYVEFTSAGNTTSVSGTVAVNDYLHVRSGPGTSYSIAGYLNPGERVVITERKTAGGLEWGKISTGWVCMDYIRLDQQSGTPDNSKTIIADCLNVRSGAGTGNSVVGYLYYGQKVTILETTTVGSMQWGKISSGWISMDYVS